MRLKCRENLDVLVEEHPYHERLNNSILEESLSFNFSRDSQGNVYGIKTQENNVCSRSIDIVREWIINLIRAEHRGWKFKCTTSWLVKYQKGEYTLSHNHIPADFSFVYFIKCPKGSSPLVLTTSGKKIKAQEGRVIILPGSMYHHISKNRSDDRMVYVGNVVHVEVNDAL